MTRGHTRCAGGLQAALSIAFALFGAGCAGTGASPPPTAPGDAPPPSVAQPSQSQAEPAAPSATAARFDAPERGRGGTQRGGVELLEFLGIGRGERVAGLGGGSRQFIQLMADAVGPAGVVFCQTDPRTLTALPSDHGQSAKPTGPLPANIVVMQTSSDVPFSGAAQQLNLVTLLFAYHDFFARGTARQKLNGAVFRALAPGGYYVIADHAAPSGSGLSAAQRLNSSDEGVVRTEVEAAGFMFVEAAELLSSSAARPEASLAGGHGSQYLLKFQKPR